MRSFLISVALIAAILGTARAANSSGDYTIVLPQPVTYFAGPPFTQLTFATAQQLLDRPLRFGQEPHPNGSGPLLPNFAAAGKPQHTAATCREYEVLRSEGYQPISNRDNKLSSFLVDSCALLRAAIVARPARFNYIDHPRVDLRDTALLPATALPPEPSDSSRDVDNGTALHRLGVHSYRTTKNSPNWVTFMSTSARIDLRELARGDFIGDGYQDILVSASIVGTKGTFAYYVPPFLLRRKHSNGPFTVVPFR